MDARELNDRWAEMLAQWAIPPEIIDAAPESPYFFDPAVFTAAADAATDRDEDSPSDRVAREALSAEGTVLDVGAGAGAASLRLAASALTGVDTNRTLLEAFAARASHLGIPHREVKGRWPDIAADVESADVVVCHHVVYNVADLASFVTALADHARRRVVIELTAVHPMSWLAPYWEALHGLVQPDSPTVVDAVAVIDALGFDAHQQHWIRPIEMIGEAGDEQVARIARRLCLQPDQQPQLRALLTQTPPPVEREVVTLWW